MLPQFNSFILSTILAFWLIANGPIILLAANKAPIYKAEIIKSIPYPPEIFTQGLFLENNLLYVSSGLYKKSAIYIFFLEESELKEKSYLKLPENIFAEGLAKVSSNLYLLTWQENQLFIFDLTDNKGSNSNKTLNSIILELKKILFYEREGWGLTYDGKVLWRSDGSQYLSTHDIKNFNLLNKILVKDGDMQITGLNELEWDHQKKLIWANIFGSDNIAAIDPNSGEVKFWLDCSELRNNLDIQKNDANAVLNGITIDQTGNLILTGKLWDKLFFVKTVDENLL